MKRILAAAVLAAALIAAGCGGDDEEEPAEPTGEKAEFIAAADEVCAGAAADETAELQEKFPNADPEQLSDKQVASIVRDILIPSLERQVKEIGALEPPPGDEGQIQEILTGLRAGIDELDEDPNAIRTGGASLPSFSEAAQMAQDYGFEQCGS